MKVYVTTGQKVVKEMPYSEICSYMGIAGSKVECEVLKHQEIQLYKDGREYSFPILYCEAGFYCDENGLYYNT